MDVGVLLAVTGAGESSLVAALEAAGGIVVARRCADLSEVLAAGQAGHGRVAMLSADLHRLDREALGRLAASGLAVVGVLPGAGSRTAGALRPQEAADRWQQLGVAQHVAVDAGRDAVVAAVQGALADTDLRDVAGRGPHDPRGRRPVRGAGPGAGTGPAAPADPAEGSTPADQAAPGRRGRLVAVWGTAGAPGRTTVATTLASELAAAHGPTLLVDADTWAASTAQVLGLLDEAAGIAGACRAAATGTLTRERLEELAPLVLPRMRVLTGLPRADRWPEIGPRALDGVWESAREVFSWVVADVAAPLECDEEIALDTAAPRRNAAALSALEAADVVLVLASADPVGLARLVRALSDLTDAVPTADVRVVVTKVRASAVGPSPQRRVREVLERFAGVEELVLVPDDRPACDAALLAGRTLTEAAPSSPARAALRDLAGQLPAWTDQGGAQARSAGGAASTPGTPGTLGVRRRRGTRRRSA